MFLEGDKLVIERCLGYEYLPKDLFNIVSIINKKGLSDLIYENEEILLKIHKKETNLEINY